MLGLAAAHWGRTRAAMVAPSQDSVARASVGCGPSMKKLLTGNCVKDPNLYFSTIFQNGGERFRVESWCPLARITEKTVALRKGSTWSMSCNMVKPDYWPHFSLVSTDLFVNTWN